MERFLLEVVEVNLSLRLVRSCERNRHCELSREADRDRDLTSGCFSEVWLCF